MPLPSPPSRSPLTISMAARWAFLLVFTAHSLSLHLLLADPGPHPEPVPDGISHDLQLQDDKAALVNDLGHTKSQLSVLEKILLEKDLSIQNKDEIIFSLQAELQAIQKGDSREVEAVLNSIQVKLEQLESKAAELEEALKEKEQDLHDFKERVQTLEAAEIRHKSRYKQLEKTFADQAKLLEKAEKALRVAQKAATRAQAEVYAKEQELLKVYGHWLPPWAATRVAQLRASTLAHWTAHGEPLLNSVIDKLSEKTAAVQRWTKPHFETIRMHVEKKWSPVLKQSWEKVIISATPYVEAVKSKSVEFYEASKAVLLPQLTKAQESVQPYLQAAREISRPYVDKAAVVLEPHFKQAQLILKPYTGKVARSYRHFLTSATKYHRQIQSQVRRTLKKNKHLSYFANKELVWFLASSLLVLPLLGTLMLLSSVLSGKNSSRSTKGAGSPGQKKVKRSKQVDK